MIYPIYFQFQSNMKTGLLFGGQVTTQYPELPTTCSRGYHAGNSNLRSGILFGGMPVITRTRIMANQRTDLPDKSLR